MRKKIFSIALTLVMLISLLPAGALAADTAADLPQLPAPTELTWYTEETRFERELTNTDGSTDTISSYVYYGDFSFATGANEPFDYTYVVSIYNENDVLIDQTAYGSGATSYVSHVAPSDFRRSVSESGTYYFTVQSLGDGVTYADSEIATSALFTYVKPDVALEAPTGVKWASSTTISWEPVDTASGHHVELYYAEDANSEPRYILDSWGNYSLSSDDIIYDWVLQSYGEGYYYARVRALSNDISTIFNSEWSELSPALNITATVEDATSNVTEIVGSLSDASTEEDISAAVDEIKAIDTSDLRAAMLTDDTDEGVMAQLKELEELTGVKTEVKTDNKFGVDAADVSITGAALNVEENNTTNKVTMNIGAPNKEVNISEAAYDNVVQIDFNLTGVGKKDESGQLAIPVKIDMPVPDGVNPQNLVLLHYHNSTDTYTEMLSPYVYPDANGNWRVSFVVDRFSVIVFANGQSVTVTEVAGGTASASLDAAGVGDRVDLTATPDDGNLFGGWSVTDANNAAVTVYDTAADTEVYFIMPDTEVTVIPSYLFPVNVWSGDGGFGIARNLEDPGTHARPGMKVELLPFKDEGYTFSGWVSDDVEIHERDGETEFYDWFIMPEHSVDIYTTWTKDVTPTPTPTPSPSPDPGPEEVTVPVSGDENAINVTVTIDEDGTVTLEPIDEEELAKVIGPDVNTGVVVIDLTGLDIDVSAVNLPSAVIEAIVEAASAANNDTEKLAVKLSTGTVELDDAAMHALIEGAEGDTIRLVLDNVGTDRLNNAQKEAIEGLDIHGGFEAFFECLLSGSRISDFGGGTATLRVPFEIPEGLNSKGFSVVYLDDDGVSTKLETRYENGELVWSVGHFS